MRKQAVECNNVEVALEVCPWASVIMAHHEEPWDDHSYMCFESWNDFRAEYNTFDPDEALPVCWAVVSGTFFKKLTHDEICG